MTFKAIASALLLAWAVGAHAQEVNDFLWIDWLKGKPPARFSQLPPPEFDHEFDGNITVLRVGDDEVREACPGKFRVGNWALGCTTKVLGSRECTIRILRDAELRTTTWAKDYDIIYRHERGHCNGWVHQ